ncbi:MAG: hypothetical protein HKN22_05675 [Bacteroidia bacterium]|nr:hypothetical protein [Bacteroidia bacterium]
MKKVISLTMILSLILGIHVSFAQKTFKEYVEKNDVEKIKKNVLMDVFTTPTSNKSFRDGHGKVPYFTSKDQLPKTVGIVTFNISDLGASYSMKTQTHIYTDFYNVGEEVGNIIANKIHKQTISALKNEFKKYGVTLLMPEEYLDTPEKKKAYQEYTAAVSKLGKFLSNVENRNTDLSVCANSYRYFDMGAAFDFLRAESLGYDLASILKVDAVLSIGSLIQTNKKEGFYRSIKMALHGPNPNPKEDKKYIAQKSGNGYYNGQLYAGSSFSLKKPINFMNYKAQTIEVDGLEVIFAAMIEKMYDKIGDAIKQ